MKKHFSTIKVMVIALGLIMAFSVSVFADVSISKINYKGSGKVQVTFSGKVSYNDTKVTIEDNNGVSYDASVMSKDNKNIQFVIKRYKTGRTYTFTISGVSKESFSGSFKIIAKNTAITTAKNTAKKKWKATEFSDVSAKSSTYKGTSVWKVSFKSGNSKYVYMVTQQKGKVIYYEKKKAE